MRIKPTDKITQSLMTKLYFITIATLLLNSCKNAVAEKTPVRLKEVVENVNFSTEDLKGTWLSLDFIKILHETNSYSTALLKRDPYFLELTFKKDTSLEVLIGGGGLPRKQPFNKLNYTFIHKPQPYYSPDIIDTYSVKSVKQDTMIVLKNDSIEFQLLRYPISPIFSIVFFEEVNKWIAGTYQLEAHGKIYNMQAKLTQVLNFDKGKWHEIELAGFKNYTSIDWSTFVPIGGDNIDIVTFSGGIMDSYEKIEFLVDSVTNNTFFLTELDANKIKTSHTAILTKEASI